MSIKNVTYLCFVPRLDNMSLLTCVYYEQFTWSQKKKILRNSLLIECSLCCTFVVLTESSLF